MLILLVIVHVIVCLFLIGVVLLQQGKSADLAGAFGGQGSQTGLRPAWSGEPADPPYDVFGHWLYAHLDCADRRSVAYRQHKQVSPPPGNTPTQSAPAKK